MSALKLYIEITAQVIEIIGVTTIALGTIITLVKYIFIYNKKPGSYLKMRQELGKSILLGLEILVAADIMATVVTEPTLNKVFALAVIVLIRTFLSLSLLVELEGRFPWQKEPGK